MLAGLHCLGFFLFVLFSYVEGVNGVHGLGMHKQSIVKIFWS